MIASASTDALKLPDGVPAWRVMVGNLAAGATAGCAVEAGACGTALLALLMPQRSCNITLFVTS